jgi:uncharacterized membrane protein YbhN (UPF0104 family)
VVLLLAGGLLTMRNFGRQIITRLPLPHKVLEFYDRFEEGALGLPDVHLGISGVFFVALAASLMTAIPITPAGIGFVEGVVIVILTQIYKVPNTDALAITLVDRAISVLSIIVIGSIFYAISPKRRGMGVSEAAPA